MALGVQQIQAQCSGETDSREGFGRLYLQLSCLIVRSGPRRTSRR